jgi:predicted ester cyclase
VIAEGDRVVTRLVMRGRSKAAFLGMDPTGKEVEVSGITIHRIASGKIVERWGNWNTVGMLQQLGRLPPLDQIG